MYEVSKEYLNRLLEKSGVKLGSAKASAISALMHALNIIASRFFIGESQWITVTHRLNPNTPPNSPSRGRGKKSLHRPLTTGLCCRFSL